MTEPKQQPEQQPEEYRENQERDQLRPIPTPHTNSTLRGPEGTNIGDLQCELAIDPIFRGVVTVSAWELDERQRELVAAGAHIRMGVWQHPIPPLSLAIEAPWCNCGNATIFVKGEGAFACPACGERVKTGSFEGTVDPRREGEDDHAGDTSRAALDQAHRDFHPSAGTEPDDEADTSN